MHPIDCHDCDLDTFLADMRIMSKLVYSFNNLRTLVRKHDGTVTKKYGYFGRATKHEFDTPALILTDDGAQEKTEKQRNISFEYDITPNAVLTFIQKNRKFFIEEHEGDYLKFDKEHKEKESFSVEEKIKLLAKDDYKIIDYEDESSTEAGGLVYAIVVNVTKKWIAVLFRGTVGTKDFLTDRDFRLNTTDFFKDDMVFVDDNTPGTHTGFTNYLFSPRVTPKGTADRPYVDRILAAVQYEFTKNASVVGKDFKLYVSGHSLGGGLANLFGFRVAQLMAKGDPSVEGFPPRVKVVSYAAPCVGDVGFVKECQYLEKQGIFRHVRIANEGDVVPTNNIPVPLNYALAGDSSLYRQNGVELFLKADDVMEVEYNTTKACSGQLNLGLLNAHTLVEYDARMGKPENKQIYNQTVEELYKIAGDFTKID